MKKLFLTMSVALVCSPALAGAPGMPPPDMQVPEMDAGAAVAAIALLVGAAAIIRERRNRK